MGHLLKFLNVSSFWDTADNVYDLYVRKCILPGALYQVLKGSNICHIGKTCCFYVKGQHILITLTVNISMLVCVVV